MSVHLLNQTKISALYAAVFSRAPDKAGLDFWSSQASANPTTVFNTIAAGFSQHPVFKEVYDNLTESAYVNALYTNILGGPGDTAGVTFWTNQLTAGRSKSEVLASFVQSSIETDLSKLTLTAAELAAATIRQQTITNKANVGVQFATLLGTASNLAPTTNPGTLAGLQSDAAYRASVDAIKNVTHVKATADNAISNLAAAVASGNPILYLGSGSSTPTVGQTFTLTADVNVFTGGAGNDTFSGGSDTIDGDVLNGGAGEDSLNLTVDFANDNNSAFSSTSIENLTIRTTATAGGVSLDLGDVIGVETLTANRLLTALTLTDVQEIADINVSRNSQNAALTVTYAADVVAGTDDSITINVINSANAGTITVDGVETVNLVSTDNATDDTNEITIDAAGSDDATEVLNISGSGDLTVTATDALTINSAASGDVELTATAATEVNHTGSGELDVTVGATVDATMSAATATGTLTVTANGDGDLTITGSAQSDTFEFGDTLANDDTVDGGDGVDTLQILGDGVASVEEGDVTVSNVETLEILSDTGTDNLDFDVFSAPAEFTTVIVTSTVDADAITLTDVQASTYTIRNAATGTVADLLGAVTIDLKDSSGTADAITVNLQNRQDGEVGNQNDFTLTTLTAAGVESMTLNATRVSTEGTAEDITITNFTTVDLESLTLTGNADLTISSTLDNETVAIDASLFEGALDITIGTNGVTYTGGSGDDTVRFGTRLTTTDSIDGGEGDDTVVATLSAGTVAPTLTNVETISVNFNGGALSGANLGEVSTLTINISTAAGVATNLSSTVTTINQQDDAVSLAFNYAAGAAATVTMNFTDDDAATIANTATQFSNVANLTIAGGNGDASDATVDLGSLSVGAATSLTVTTDDDAGDTLDTGNITGASLSSLTVAADEANILIGTVAAAALSSLTIGSTGAGEVTVGAITAGDDVTSVSITSSDLVHLDDITATDSDITSFTVNLEGTYGASAIDTVVADNITTLSITTNDEGTSLAIEKFTIDESIGNIVINAGAGFDGLDDFIDTGATGSIGNITITANGAMTIADAGGEMFITDALAVGNISITTTEDGSANIGGIEDALTVGDITINAEGNVTFDGAVAATTVGNISVTVAEGVTVDMNDVDTGAAGGVIGTITASGEGSFTFATGAVTSMGTIDLSDLSGTSNIALDALTTIGVVATLGSGADTFVGTGGADVITAGLGADIITGGNGNDTIDLTEATSSVDTVVFAATNTGSDTVSGFTFGTGGDLINVELLGGGNIGASAAIAANATIANIASGTAIVFANGADGAGDATITDYLNFTQVAAFIDAGLDVATTETFAVVINDLINDIAYVYNVVEADNTTVDAGEVTLVGTISAANANVAFTTANLTFTA